MTDSQGETLRNQAPSTTLYSTNVLQYDESAVNNLIESIIRDIAIRFRYAAISFQAATRRCVSDGGIQHLHKSRKRERERENNQCTPCTGVK